MRIYLDKNIFSYLKKEESYSELLELMRGNNRRHIYFFSKAHLDDLKNDKTEKKYEDMEFMEEFTGKNYLCKSFNNYVNCFIASPLEAFGENLDDGFDYDFESILEHPDLKEKAKELKNIMKDTELNIEIPDRTPPVLKDYLINITSQKEQFDLLKIIEDGIQFQDRLQNDKTSYKNLRRFNIENHKHIFNTISGEINENNIDKLFLNSKFELSFLDFIDKQLSIDLKNQKDDGYYRFVTAYLSLNMLGIDKEKNKKANFLNTISDSCHAYYAGLCDIFVTDDKGIIDKANIIYKLCKIDTKIIHIDNFNKYLLEIEKREENILENIQSSVIEDINYGKLILEEDNDEYKILKFYTKLPYFSFFQNFQINLNKKKHTVDNIIFLASTSKIGRLIVYEEIKQITNYCIEKMGPDYHGRSKYDERDFDMVNNNKWKGRIWAIINGYIHLNISTEMNICYLDICLKEKKN